MPIAPADSTLVAIRKKTRRLIGSPSEASLSTADLDQAINTFYSQDFPYGIKIDQMRSVYTFFTRPYIDRYPLDVNFNQGVRGPVYVEGIQGSFFKDRQQFYALWPRFPTKFQPPGLNSGTISNITAANPPVVTSSNHGLQNGLTLFIDGIVGTMDILNGSNYVISVIDANNFSLNTINTIGLTYTSGGTWINLLWEFNIPGPFLSKEVVIGSVTPSGTAISINDDGNGNLISLVPNPVISIPAANTNPALPGMYNLNTGNPGLLQPTLIGAVDYVTGNFSINFAILGIGEFPDPAQTATLWVSQYQTGRPYSLLFWNNEFTIRPVPKLIHKVEVETFLTPTQFLEVTDSPILNQWYQYIAYGTARELLRERQDMEGVENLAEGMARQEALVLERQAIEEIFTPNSTIFNSVTPSVGGINGIGYFNG